ncbi:MAG: transglutaminase-like domain-containing protein [Candidatus Daviesbacteria bacterium]|nr:transglutaminase-like domain-containing protein [Candidatus Daviesbacteria bacterium]
MFKVFFGLFLFLLAILPSPVFADNEFATTYNVTYDFEEDGTASVTQKINIRNLTSQYYVSDFNLTIGSTEVTEVSAVDSKGPMEAKVEQKDNQGKASTNKTSITVKFNQQVVGVDKSQAFTLKLKSRDFAQAIGKTWEINLPKIPAASNLENYNLVLSVPISFGEPTSISPKPKEESQTFNRLFFTFEKDQLERNGVSINFGTTQFFDYNLKYQLQNDSLFPVVTSITLPPDTQYQDVLVNKINPEPVNVTVDPDGNYLAWYKMPRGSSQEVNVFGSAKLYINPKKDNPPGARKIPTLTESQRQDLTKSDTFWDTTNPAVTAVLDSIFEGDYPQDSTEKARRIYDYVVNNLQYDESRLSESSIERLGAVTVLNNPSKAICMEFTDLFITLARGAGIPARELDGFAYSQNQNLRPLSLSRDLLHAWPEYYDDNRGWVMVDPTWENTSGGVDYFNKFDLNHFVLAIKGSSSETPYTSDDVKVTVADKEFAASFELGVQIDIPERLWAGFPAKGKIKVINSGQSVSLPGTLTIASDKIKILGEKTIKLGSIPPFGHASYEFNLRTPSVVESFEEAVEVSLNNQVFSKLVSVKPFYIFKPFPYLFIGIAVFIILLYLGVLAFHIFRKRSKSPRSV